MGFSRANKFLCGILLALAFASSAHAQAVDATADNPANSAQETPEPQNWNLHFQTTAIGQGYPAFHGVNGPQSLSSQGQVKETRSDTLFAGVRMPWSSSENSTEFYLDPETVQGFGLSHVAGVGGFPSGESEKAGSDYPRLNIARGFLRQTFGFGGEQEALESDQNQLAGARDISRLTISVGKVAVTDFFDNNSYSHDARSQFMNIALMDGGAYDYAGDQKGYTDGAVFELNQAGWAIRYGYFFAPKYANAPDLEENYNGKGAHNLELEERYKIADQPGVLRMLGFANIANAGSYRDALAYADPTEGLDATRTARVKYGFVLNAEQALSDDLGLFSRFSWNDGQEEIVSTTDIDQSLSLGASFKGTRWGRPDDTVGVAGAIDMLSQAQVDYFKAGGLGIIVGDGFLDYAPEDILETYYNYRVFKPLWLTGDYQFIANPGYNATRGPANIFSVRAHIEF
jgi:high affinity Mn2+ porin